MKNTRTFIYLILPFFLFMSSCDDDFMDITESFTFEQEFVVDTESAAFSEVYLLDLARRQSLIDQYGNKIKDIEVERIRYWVKQFGGDANQTIENASFMVSDVNDEGRIAFASFQGKVISSLVNNPQELNLQDLGIDKLENFMQKPPHTFILSMEGNASEAPLNFIVVLEIKARMTANPLK